MVLERWNLVYPMVERMVNSMVMILLRYLKYLPAGCIFHGMNMIIQQCTVNDDVKMVRPHHGEKGQTLYWTEHVSLSKF